MSTENGSDEREFLHAIASPLGTALFLLDAILEGMQDRADADPAEAMQLGEAHQALLRAKDLLQERREVLIKKGVPSARS